MKYCTIMLSNNIIYYYGSLNNDYQKNYSNDFECKQLKNLTDFKEISLIDNKYIIVI